MLLIIGMYPCFDFIGMSYRFMRVMVMFDLPMESSADLKQYRKFRKYLIKNGFVMQQKSIYTKIVLNQTGKDNIIEALERNKPDSGLVQVLSVTEKQYAKMKFLVGESKTNVISDDRKLVIL